MNSRLLFFSSSSSSFFIFFLFARQEVATGDCSRLPACREHGLWKQRSVVLENNDEKKKKEEEENSGDKLRV